MNGVRAVTQWIQIRLSILSMTLVWAGLILFPVSLRQLGLIVRTLRRNMRLMPRFFEALLVCRREQNISWGVLLLSTPVIAMIVLLDEYE